MKKFFLMMCLCMAAVCANAQKVTVWYGANMSKVSGDLKGDSEFKFLNVGATLTAPLSDQFDWSAGLAYVTKGCENWDPSLLQIDANAHYNFYNNEEVKVGILAGPYVGYMINDDDMEGAKKLDFGLSAGLQASYRQFSLKVGYEFSLSKAAEFEYDDEDEDISISGNGKFRGLYIRLGYTF